MNKIDWNINALPDELREKIWSSEWEQITIGESGAYTYLLKNEKYPKRYLKISPCNLQLGTEREAEMMNWLKGKLPVPEVLAFMSDSEYEYLLTSEIKGCWSFDKSLENDISSVVRLYAKGLKMIHSIDISECLFEQSLKSKLKEAEYRVANGLVDEEDFDESRLGRKAADLFQELQNKKPDTEDLVFTHGDYCMPNILIYKGEIGGFIDWGRGGIADRYQDLALAERSLKYNFGEEWVPQLFEEYGLDNIDYSKIEYYKLLDEMF